MAELGGALLTRIFAKSVAEQALTPWWDKVKEYSTYGLIILGKIFLFIFYILSKSIFWIHHFSFDCSAFNTCFKYTHVL